jgi:hypothetical protein
MDIRVLSLSLLVAAGSLSPAFADDVTDQINQALSAYSRKDLPTAILGLQSALDLMRQSRADTYGALLPNPPPGWTGEKVETVSLGVAMAGGGTGATRKYTRGNETVTVSILADSPMLQAMSALAGSGLAGIGGMQTRIVNGRRTIFVKDDASYTMIVADHILLRVEGRGQTEETLKQFLTGVDLAALERAGH